MPPDARTASTWNCGACHNTCVDQGKAAVEIAAALTQARADERAALADDLVHPLPLGSQSSGGN